MTSKTSSPSAPPSSFTSCGIASAATSHVHSYSRLPQNSSTPSPRSQPSSRMPPSCATTTSRRMSVAVFSSRSTIFTETLCRNAELAACLNAASRVGPWPRARAIGHDCSVRVMVRRLKYVFHMIGLLPLLPLLSSLTFPEVVSETRVAQVRLAETLAEADAIESVTAHGREVTFVIVRDGD